MATRYKFLYKDRIIYEWEQNLEEVIVYITPPKGVSSKHLNIEISTQNLIVGLKGNPPFLNIKLFDKINIDSSIWTIEDGELVITLQKIEIGKTWTTVCPEHDSLNSFEHNKVKEKILLERFQRENPGFDFSGAKFTGEAAEANTFLGGVDVNNLK